MIYRSSPQALLRLVASEQVCFMVHLRGFQKQVFPGCAEPGKPDIAESTKLGPRGMGRFWNALVQGGL